MLLSLPLASLVLTALPPVFAARACRSRWWTRHGRLAYSTFALLAVAFMTFLNYWKLLGIRYWARDDDRPSRVDHRAIVDSGCANVPGFPHENANPGRLASGKLA